MEFISTYASLIIWAGAVAAILYGAILSAWILRLPDGDQKMRDIASAIQEGAAAYLMSQTKVIAIVAAVMGLIIFQFFK